MDRYYLEREDYLHGAPDFFVMDRQTGLAVDVSTVEARAQAYCDRLNREHNSKGE